MENPFLIGKRIYLRPLEMKDGARIVSWLNDPEIQKTIERRTPINLAAEEESIRDLYRTEPPLDVVFGVILKVDEALLGVTGLHGIDWINRRAQTDILIGNKKYWNRGLGTEAKNLLIDYAFRTLNLNSVYAKVSADNQRAVAACIKQGYKEAGRFRRACFRDGDYEDEILLELLRAEWSPPPVEEPVETPARAQS